MLLQRRESNDVNNSDLYPDFWLPLFLLADVSPAVDRCHMLRLEGTDAAYQISLFIVAHFRDSDKEKQWPKIQLTTHSYIWLLLNYVLWQQTPITTKKGQHIVRNMSKTSRLGTAVGELAPGIGVQFWFCFFKCNCTHVHLNKIQRINFYWWCPVLFLYELRTFSVNVFF